MTTRQFECLILITVAAAVILGCLGLFGHPYIWNLP